MIICEICDQTIQPAHEHFYGPCSARGIGFRHKTCASIAAGEKREFLDCWGCGAEHEKNCLCAEDPAQDRTEIARYKIRREEC